MREWDQRVGARHAAARARPHPGHARDHAVGPRARLHRRGGRRPPRPARGMTALAIDNATLYERQADHAQAAAVAARGRPRRHLLAGHPGRARGARAHGRDVARLPGGAHLRVRRRGRRDDHALRVPGEPDRLRGPGQAVPARRLPLGQGAAGERRRRRRDHLRPGPARRRARVDGAPRREDVPHRPAAVRRPARLGMLTLVETAAEREFSEADLEFARGFGEQAAMAMHNAQLFENVKGLHLGNLRALSSALTAKDIYTIGHTARVAAYAVLLAAELGWTPRRIQLLEEATYLHDIGKIAVADRVLLKSGALTDEEWALMKQHPTISAEIIEALLDEEYVAGVRHHHERYDGDRLSGRPGRRGHPRRRPAPVPRRLLRRHVVAPRVPAGADARGVRRGAAQLQRHAVRPGAWWRRSSASSPTWPRSARSCRSPPSRRRPRIDAADHAVLRRPRGRGPRRVRARPARPARDAARAPRGGGHVHRRRRSTSCAA